MVKLLSASLLLMAGPALWAQDAPPRSFEVASIKPAAPCCAPGQWRESKAGIDRIDFPNVTLRYCIAFAWRLKEYQVTGPAWIGQLRYDILAKGPEGTVHDQLPEMMQALLAERFQLQVHHESKEFNVFVLAVGKSGLKLKDSAPKTDGGPDGASFGISMSPAGIGRIEVRNGTMTALANTLPRFVGRPVVDQTGLAGKYDFELEFSREDANGMVTPPAPPPGQPAAAELGASIFSSVQRIGLRLDAQKLPMDSIVIDRAEKTATEN